MFTAGSRVFVTGFGCPKSEDAAAQVVKDGCIGTVYAAYHFVDAILGYEFVYETFDSCPYQPDVTMPGEYRFERTCAALAAQLPPAVDGTVMYSIPTYTKAELNQYCLIFKTRAGKIVVIDSGRWQGVDHLLRCLYSLSGGEKPVISAWIMTHTHDDHSGGFMALCADPALAGQVTVEHFYHHLVDDRFYLETAVDRHPDHAAAAHALRKGAADMGAKIHVVQTGDTLDVEELHFEVCMPRMKPSTAIAALTIPVWC